MYTASIEQSKLKQLYHYANTLRNTAKRRYANQYIHYLHNGATGLEPERGKLSIMAAQAVRLEIAAMQPYG